MAPIGGQPGHGDHHWSVAELEFLADGPTGVIGREPREVRHPRRPEHPIRPEPDFATSRLDLARDNHDGSRPSVEPPRQSIPLHGPEIVEGANNGDAHAATTARACEYRQPVIV